MRWASLVIFLIGAAAMPGCKKKAATDTNPERPDKMTAMTDMDPSSPQAWEQAKAIAAKESSGQLDRRSEALPFMFMADAPAAVLVHKGAVVKEKGAAVAGRYLRDLGVIEGTGPKIDDVLFVLFALDAWPTVPEAKPEGYVNVPDDKRLQDLTARVEHDGEAARVILHYFLPDKPVPAAEVDDEVGDEGGDDMDPVIRRVANATLEIQKTGDPEWKVVEINWAEPGE